MSVRTLSFLMGVWGALWSWLGLFTDIVLLICATLVSDRKGFGGDVARWVTMKPLK